MAKERPREPRTMRGVRMSDAEWQAAREAARKRQQYASEYIRDATLEKIEREN